MKIRLQCKKSFFILFFYFMDYDFSEPSYKVVLAGSSGVGKTSILFRLVDDIFIEQNQPTIGVEFKTYSTIIENHKIKLQIWDTAGQERFRSVSKAYFRNSVGALIVFDVTFRDSFDQVKNWIKDLENLSSPNSYIILVGNKIDLSSDRVISEREAQDFAIRHGMIYIETSALQNKNISETFLKLSQGIFKNLKKSNLKTLNKEIDNKKININDYGPQNNNCNC